MRGRLHASTKILTTYQSNDHDETPETPPQSLAVDNEEDHGGVGDSIPEPSAANLADAQTNINEQGGRYTPRT